MDHIISSNSIEDLLRRKRAEGKIPNRLLEEKSPYLLQHAYNPVAWYPWGTEAFEKARVEDKPIFLSIGYSTCYWCHVMEREVFENESIAALMNELVVSIKVDREELPEVDRVYMAALMGMSGSGGWPMSMFLTHDLHPFFGATYIPPTPRHGMPGFQEILERVNEIWTSDRQKILEAGSRLTEFLRANSGASDVRQPADPIVLQKGFEAFQRSYDQENGGFGSSTKFPTPVNLTYLLQYHWRTGSRMALEMVMHTLDRMRDGGIYDHLAGGFHRYATDAHWHVPHFEKMLYDQALCATAYLEAYQLSGERRHAETVREILAYVTRDLTDPAGGQWSAEDAESAPDASRPDEKREGAFYCWTKSEIDAVLTSQESEVFGFVYDVRAEGNVSADPHGVFRGVNILHRVRGEGDATSHLQASTEQIEGTLRTAEKKLLQVRGFRPRPGLDDKVLVSWNGLMISAFARAFQVLRDPAYLSSAEKAGEFIFQTLRGPAGKVLLRRYRRGEARFEGQLEDYAYLIQAVIDLYEASFDVRWLRRAIDLTEEQIDIFHDANRGGFFDARQDVLSEIVRTKEAYDGATPSGNSVAILNLLRLSAMVHDERYAAIAHEGLVEFGGRVSANPQGTSRFLSALDRSLEGARQVVIAGPKDDPKTQNMLRLVHSIYDPHRVVLLADGGEGQGFLASREPFFQEIHMIGGEATAYVCKNFVCDAPTTDLTVLGKLLSGR